MSILFPNAADAESELTSYINVGAKDMISLSDISTALMDNSINAAEADLQRRLRVFFQNTKVLPDDTDSATIDALKSAGTPYWLEAAYDYDPEFFIGNRWGSIVTKERPINSVESISFAFPSPQNQLFTIPNDWIRMDQRYGQIRLVPATQSFSAPLSAYVMQALGGGMTIPFMIHVVYWAGLQNISTEWPDIPDLVMKMAVLRLFDTKMQPGSMSTSADGLSESTSVTLKDWHDNLDDQVERLRQAIHGIRVSALGVF